MPATPAAVAAVANDVEVLRALPAADIDSADDSGNTPLIWAVHAGSEAAVELLLNAGVTYWPIAAQIKYNNYIYIVPESSTTYGKPWFSLGFPVFPNSKGLLLAKIRKQLAHLSTYDPNLT